MQDNNTDELKNEGKENKISYSPLSTDILKDLLKKSKGIETLWKKIKDNQDGTKSELYKYENDLVKLVGDFSTAFKQVKDNDKENKIDLGKNLASKESYRVMVTQLLTGAGEADAFIKKFPHWTIQVGRLFAGSIHYQRIASKNSGSGMTTDDIDEKSIFNVAKKNGEKKTGKESKKGFLKSISSFFSKYIKRGGMFKASKSKVTIELAKFGEYVNEPWRRWWETVAEPNTKLSKKKAKESLKSALSDSTSDSKAKLVCLFNTGKVKDNAGLEGPYVKLITEEKSDANIIEDGPKSTVNKMYQIFKAIDAKLGNKVEALFRGSEGAKNLDTNDDKIKKLLELHKNFYGSQKAIRFSEVFDELEIKKDSKPQADAVKTKVGDIFKDSTYSDNKTAQENVEKLAEDARTFLEAYYNADKTKRFIYELRFLGRHFNINALNKVEKVDDAIKVLNTIPENKFIRSLLRENDPQIEANINQMIETQKQNIKNLDDALKNLDNINFNSLGGMRALKFALEVIVEKTLIDGVSNGKINLVDFINDLINKNKKAIAEKIQGMDLYQSNKNENLDIFIQKLDEQINNQQQVEENQNQVNFDKINKVLKNNKVNSLEDAKKIKDKQTVNKIIKGLIDAKVGIQHLNSRKMFLIDVAQSIGFKGVNNQNIEQFINNSRGTIKDSPNYELFYRVNDMFINSYGEKKDTMPTQEDLNKI